MQYRRAFLCFACFCAFAASFPSPATAGPETVKDRFFFGVGIHLGQKENKSYPSAQTVIPKVEQLGANSTRDDLPWRVMGAKTRADLPDSIDKMADGLNQRAARPVLILKGDRSKIPGNQPRNDKERALYAALAAHAAVTLKDYDPIFEIWNEWNLAARKDKSLGSAENYVAMAKAAYPAIKKEMPRGLVLGGVAGDDRNWEWTLKAVDLGLLDYADGLSVHPYNYCSPGFRRTGWNALLSVRMLHDKLKKRFPERDVPIYITEIGWPERDGECGGISRADAAANAAQILLEAPTYPWLKGVWFYELLDQGEDPEDREDHFGLFGRDEKIKPAGCAAQTAWEFIAETHSPARAYPYEKMPFVTFETATGSKRVAVWNMSAMSLPRWVKFPPSARFVSLCRTKTPKAGEWVRVEKTPILAEIPAKDYNTVIFDESVSP